MPYFSDVRLYEYEPLAHDTLVSYRQWCQEHNEEYPQRYAFPALRKVGGYCVMVASNKGCGLLNMSEFVSTLADKRRLWLARKHPRAAKL